MSVEGSKRRMGSAHVCQDFGVMESERRLSFGILVGGVVLAVDNEETQR